MRPKEPTFALGFSIGQERPFDSLALAQDRPFDSLALAQDGPFDSLALAQDRQDARDRREYHLLGGEA